MTNNSTAPTSQFICSINSLRPRQNGRLFADDTSKRIFLNENIRISTRNSVKFVPNGLINDILALVLIMAWRRPGDKPLSEPMLVRSLTHICVTWPQWVNSMFHIFDSKIPRVLWDQGNNIHFVLWRKLNFMFISKFIVILIDFKIYKHFVVHSNIYRMDRLLLTHWGRVTHICVGN